MTNVRDFIKSELEPLLPDDYVIIPEQRMPDTIKKTTVVLKHSHIESLAAAPIGHAQHDVILSIFTPKIDTYEAENELDDAVAELITVIDGHGSINWTEANKVLSPNEQNLGWDIKLTTITSKEA